MARVVINRLRYFAERLQHASGPVIQACFQSMLPVY